MNIASNTKRSGRAVRRADRIRHHVNYLPELDRGIPYLDLMTPEQVERIRMARVSTQDVPVQGCGLIQASALVVRECALHQRRDARCLDAGDG